LWKLSHRGRHTCHSCRAQRYRQSLLDDGIVQGQATGSEFRTMPLWRVSERSHFLHDGRVTSITEAIEAHGGQAAAFEALLDAEKTAFLVAPEGPCMPHWRQPRSSHRW
jgi:hypothetical protein